MYCVSARKGNSFTGIDVRHNANGSQKLMEMSDIVCPAVTEDGLAKAFKDLGLSE
jgi:hypothetical protein